VSARFFSLRFSLPSSPDHSSFSLCVHQMGYPACSIISAAEIPLDGEQLTEDFIANATRSLIQQHLVFESTLIVPDFALPVRRRESLRLFLNQERSLWIAPGLALKVTLHCQKHYFGASCSVRCAPSARTLCEAAGRVACAPGWTGEGCATRKSEII
ncbi:hypothetical protein PMAYCL1PPCAC_16701, partial [Pristionchus mayeri]